MGTVRPIVDIHPADLGQSLPHCLYPHKALCRFPQTFAAPVEMRPCQTPVGEQKRHIQRGNVCYCLFSHCRPMTNAVGKHTVHLVWTVSTLHLFHSRIQHEYELALERRCEFVMRCEHKNKILNVTRTQTLHYTILDFFVGMSNKTT